MQKKSFYIKIIKKKNENLIFFFSNLQNQYREICRA